MTYLAVPIAAESVTGACRQIKAAQVSGAGLLELRTDYLKELSIENFRIVLDCAKSTALPVIVTCRDAAEGGRWNWPMSLRTQILADAAVAGAAFIDCEYGNYLDDSVRDKLTNALSGSPGTRLILSAHNFEGCFENLPKQYDMILTANGRAIPKLVYTAGHINDCFQALELLKVKGPDADAIIFCMGHAGLLSRVLAKKFSSLITYASVDKENATATGQVTIDQYRKYYRWDAVGEATEVFGLIGNPVGHSLSPAVFNACFENEKADAVYLPLLVEGGRREIFEFMDNIASRPWLGFSGFSVTIPHKVNAFDYVCAHGEFIEPLAVNIRAVNTLKVGFGGIMSGYNTDYAGALDAMTSALGISRHQLHSVKVAVMGAGGVARAVVAGLADVGAKITIYNRTQEKAHALAEEFHCRYSPIETADCMDADVLVNCTSVGMYPDVEDMPVPAEWFREGMVVFDTVYNPLETRFLNHARKAGAKTVSGLEMFIRQAMAQYRIFTGYEPDEKVMRKVSAELLK